MINEAADRHAAKNTTHLAGTRVSTGAASRSSEPPNPTPPTSSIAESKPARFLSPLAGTALPHSGAIISGASDPAFADHLWLADVDIETGRIYPDTKRPLVVEPNGTWSFREYQIGDHVGQRLEILLIKADLNCESMLRAAEPTKNNGISFPSLPNGCAIADSADIIVE